MKKNRVIISMSRGIPTSRNITLLCLKIMDYNSRIDKRCAAAQIVPDNDPDVLEVKALRLELAKTAKREILGNDPS